MAHTCVYCKVDYCNSLSTEEVTRTQNLQGDVEMSCTDKTKTPCIIYDP